MPTTTRYTVIDGEILSENRGGTKRDYVPDPLGSTLALLDNTQTQTDTFSYYPYGEVASRTGTTATPFQYIGTLGYYQDNSGRTYVRARHLRTAHGRWMTQDPIGFIGGDFNLYRYVGNMVVSEIDITGLSVKLCKRPVNKLFPGEMGDARHYFIATSQCGCVGYGKQGVIWGCAANLGDYCVDDMECKTVKLTYAQEKCICDLARNLRRPPIRGNNKEESDGGGPGTTNVMCGRLWREGDYHPINQNCQDFYMALVVKCTGKFVGQCPGCNLWGGIDWYDEIKKYAPR